MINNHRLSISLYLHRMLTPFVLSTLCQKSKSKRCSSLKKLRAKKIHITVIREGGMVSTLDCEDIKPKNFIFLVGVPPKLLYQRRYLHSTASLMVDNCEKYLA